MEEGRELQSSAARSPARPQNPEGTEFVSAAAAKELYGLKHHEVRARCACCVR